MNDWTASERAAIEAVRLAVRVCRAVQRRLVTSETLVKKDRSPVTVADFASQAVVCARLAETMPGDRIIAEEDATVLRTKEQAAITQVVVDHVAVGMGRSVDSEQVLKWIDFGGQHEKVAGPRFWTLDPIDGTKGFLRGDQYAIALALIERGQVTIGVLACPGLPAPDCVGGLGVLLVAIRGKGAYILSPSDDPARVYVSDVCDPRAARFCESVESGHSSHRDAAAVAGLLGISAQPLRMDSQAKYATLARGDASIYLRMPTQANYRENIWDHAAGTIIVEEAGGVVTDVSGTPLDFSCGSTLQKNRGIVATNGKIHDAVIKAVRKVLG